MSISDILLDASIEEGLVLFAKLIKLGTAKSELMFKHKSGTTRWWIVDAVKLSETQFLGFTKDITQRKEIEEALRTKHIGLELKNNELIIAKRKAEESEALKRKLVANIGDVIVIIDYEGINRYKSPNLEKLFGWQPEELVGSSTLNNVHPDDQDSAQRFIASLVNEPGKIGTTELRYRHKNGRYSWIELTGSNMLNDPDIKGLLGNYHVITERKLSEQALLDSEKMFRTAIYNAPLPIMIHLEGGKVETLNFQWQKVTGYSLEEIPTISIWAEKAYGFNNDVIKSEIEKLYEIDGKEYEGEYIITTKSGEQRNFFFSSTSIGETSDGNNIVISMALDLTERVRVVEELKVREAKYRTMLNDFPDGVIIIDVKGIITEISEIGLDLLGAENGEELIGKSFFRYLPTKEKKIIKEAIEKTLSEGIIQNIELKIRKKSKLMFLSEISLTLIQSPDAVLYSFMITIRDISQRKKMEKIQIHADRMVGLGEMASGIAHEINQPLNTLSLVIDNILYEAAKDKNIEKKYLKKKAEKIFENITRIKNIIDHIRAFSRTNDDYILTGFNINSSINNAVSMISEQFKHLDISLDLQLEGNPPLIIGNTFQFEQVILNMLSNAKDALLEKKKIQNTPFDMLIGIRSFIENLYLIIEITDNGTGISDEDIEDITLPFYTTKDTGKGTGLGLSISYHIIKEMNGALEIRSDKHTGTTFKINLMIPNKK
jgi:PAS domain S-box-containing protein